MPDGPVPKSEWGDGPWQTEPDIARFNAYGLPCAAIRTWSGVWCGYVAVPVGHPLFGWRHTDSIPIRDGDLPRTVGESFDTRGVIPAFMYMQSGEHANGTAPLCMVLEAHGGVNFSGETPFGIEGTDAALWWFGFDCSHCNDFAPHIAAVMRHAEKEFGLSFPSMRIAQPHQTYRTLDYVVSVCTTLAEQLQQFKDRELTMVSVKKESK